MIHKGILVWTADWGFLQLVGMPRGTHIAFKASLIMPGICGERENKKVK